jgi:hypothetical protein
MKSRSILYSTAKLIEQAAALTLGVDLEGYHGFGLSMAVAGDDRIGSGEVELCARYLQSILRSVTHPAEVRRVPIIVGLQKHHTLLQTLNEFKVFTYIFIYHSLSIRFLPRQVKVKGL